MPYKILALTEGDITLTQRAALGRLLADAYAYAYPEDPPLDPAREGEGLLHAYPGETVLALAAFAGERALGLLKLTVEGPQAGALLIVAPDARRQGLGRALLARGRAEATARGVRLLRSHTTTRVPAGAAFAQGTGATPVQENHTNRLDLQAVDWAWVQAQAGRHGAPYRLHLWERVPEDWLERVARLQLAMHDEPRGAGAAEPSLPSPEAIRAEEEQARRLGETRFLLLAEDERSGEGVAYTEVFWGAGRAALVYQGSTGVARAARGQGLAGWVKAAMLLHLRTLPGARWVRTGNAEENVAMRHINDTLGFRHWATTTAWELTLP